jgi:hypothetical protein
VGYLVPDDAGAAVAGLDVLEAGLEGLVVGADEGEAAGVEDG